MKNHCRRLMSERSVHIRSQPRLIHHLRRSKAGGLAGLDGVGVGGRLPLLVLGEFRHRMDPMTDLACTLLLLHQQLSYVYLEGFLFHANEDM